MLPATKVMGLPCEFPNVPGLNPERCEMFSVDPELLMNCFIDIQKEYAYFTDKANIIRGQIHEHWTWHRATTQLLSHYGISLI